MYRYSDLIITNEKRKNGSVSLAYKISQMYTSSEM